jgi:transposase
LTSSEIVLGLPNYEITDFRISEGGIRITARYLGPRSCPHCGGESLRNKGRYTRRVRHENLGVRHCILELEACKWQCRTCQRYFRDRFPGILPCQRSSEAFQRMIFRDHLDGINRSRVARREGIGAATVERYFQRGLKRQFGEWHSSRCPQVLGIDEHFFTRRKGFATTLCDLKNHKVYDVVLGRSELSLEAYFQKLEGKADVRVVCMDLSVTYRSLVRLHFPNARIVADRFHVIRIVNHHFLACWREIDGVGSKNRGLLSLMRRHRHNLKPEQQLRLANYLAQHPALETIYRFKQRLCYLLLKKHRTRHQCEALVPRFLRAVYQLREAGLAQLVQLGETLSSWSEEIVAMWRFTRNNGITEGFHNKMELINRQAYGFRNFQNYRLRVKVLCS